MTPALLDLVVKTSVLAVAASLVVVLMRRASAASRHHVWTGLFVAILAVPIARLALPELPIPVLPGSRQGQRAEGKGQRAEGKAQRAEGEPAVYGAWGADAAAGPPSVAAAVASVDSMPARAPLRPAARWLTAIWLCGVACFLVRLLAGSIRVRRWARHARSVTDSGLLSRLDRVRSTQRIRRPIALLESPHPCMPVTWGLFRPTILVPSTLAHARDDASDCLDAVLAHECAHIARRDAIGQLVAEVAVSVWWFNPLVWAAAREARLERERACDDAVLARGMRASDYAAHLVAIVRTLQPAPAATVNTLAMARRSRLEERVKSILNSGVDRRAGSRSSVLVAGALIVFMLPMSAGRLTARTVSASAPDPAANVIVPPSTVVATENSAEVSPPAPVPTRSPRAATVGFAASAPETPSSQPQAAQPPPTQPQDADEKWRAERAEMFRQLVERARRHLADAKARVQIGTLAPFEVAAASQMLQQVELAAQLESVRTVVAAARDVATELEKAAMRERFARVMRNLEMMETRYNVGLENQQSLADAIAAAVESLRLAADRNAASGTAMSDADLIAALRNAPNIRPDRARADALLAISGRHALSPEMVALYVAAANSISTESERARVFVQRILVKGLAR